MSLDGLARARSIDCILWSFLSTENGVCSLYSRTRSSTESGFCHATARHFDLLRIPSLDHAPLRSTADVLATGLAPYRSLTNLIKRSRATFAPSLHMTPSSFDPYLQRLARARSMDCIHWSSYSTATLFVRSGTHQHWHHSMLSLVRTRPQDSPHSAFV